MTIKGATIGKFDKATQDNRIPALTEQGSFGRHTDGFDLIGIKRREYPKQNATNIATLPVTFKQLGQRLRLRTHVHAKRLASAR